MITAVIGTATIITTAAIAAKRASNIGLSHPRPAFVF
jgi:hypothetical protein